MAERGPEEMSEGMKKAIKKGYRKVLQDIRTYIQSEHTKQQHLTDLYDGLYGYFEDRLVGDGANSFNDFEKAVSKENVGPCDRMLWDFFEHVSNNMKPKIPAYKVSLERLHSMEDHLNEYLSQGGGGKTRKSNRRRKTRNRKTKSRK